MKCLVFGASGQLGQALTEHLRLTCDVTAWTRSTADIAAPGTWAPALRALKPEAIFNCAAFARVDEAEDSPVEALTVNALAVRGLARAANDVGAALVHYSTDFVFDGVDAGPHTEDGEPHPRGVYATSKLLGEWFAADAARHYILRVESLFGGPAAKSSVDQLLDGLLGDREVRPFSDRSVTPSYVVDVASASLALVERNVASGLYHCVNSGATNWLELTREMARLLGKTSPIIRPTEMAGLTLRVPRPLNAALSNAKLLRAGVAMPTWQDALRRHIDIRLKRS